MPDPAMAYSAIGWAGWYAMWPLPPVMPTISMRWHHCPTGQ